MRLRLCDVEQEIALSGYVAWTTESMVGLEFEFLRPQDAKRIAKEEVAPRVDGRFPS